MNKRLTIPIIFFFTVILITVYKCLIGFNVDLFFEPGDSLTWKSLAITIFEKNIYQESFPVDEPFRSWRTPGYPFYLSIILSLNMFDIPFLFTMNIIFIISSFILIFLVSKNFIKSNNIKYLIIFYCVITHIDTLSALSQKNMNETLYLLLISLSLYLILLKNKIASSIGFFILGLSVLVRSTVLPLYALSILILIIVSLHMRKNFFQIKFFLFFIPLFFWFLRNYFIFNEFGYFIGANSDHLLLGTFKYVDWQFIDNLFNNIDTNGRSFEVLRSEMRMKFALSRIFDNPFQYLFIKMDVFVRHLFDHFSIIPLILAYLAFNGLEKKLVFIKNNKLIFILFILSFIFLAINSITIYNPRYGVIASFYLSFFSLIIFSKILELNQKYK